MTVTDIDDEGVRLGVGEAVLEAVEEIDAVTLGETVLLGVEEIDAPKVTEVVGELDSEVL